MTRYASRADRVGIGLALLFLLSRQSASQQLQPQQLFQHHCVGCHGDEGRGSGKGPALTMNQRVAEQTPEQLSGYLERGNVAAGMPAFADLSADERTALARYLRRLNVETILAPVAAAEPAAKIAWGAPQPGDWP